MKKLVLNKKSKYLIISSSLALLISLNLAFPFAYIFAGDANGLDVITHPEGYTGTGGVITVNISINPSSPNAGEMIIPVQNAVAVYNNLLTSNPNVSFGPGAPFGSQIDFESVLLHEVGHSLGLAHCNAATESGLAGNDQNYTKATDGDDDVFTTNSGNDGIIGSGDDFRGDDVNLNYFKIADNNPFTSNAVIDNTTYSRDFTDLPNGDLFSANADRNVADALGFPGIEAVMQQGTFNAEEQRRLSEDDFAGLKYAQSGLNETQGNNDDYTLVLQYLGLNNNGDIVIQFDDEETGFAVSQSGGIFIGANHTAISGSNIFFNSGSNWYFNDDTLDIENDLSETLGLSIYPNPTRNSVTITNPSLVKLEFIDVYDLNGRLIKSNLIDVNANNYKIDIDISNFDSGVYIFEIKSSQGIEIKKIIKE